MSGVASFEIKIDRSNRIYNGGELVRGKVKLVTTKDIQTRSIRIRFQGIGFMYFCTGSGSHRSDHYGSKVYQEHRHTIFGNYYRTSVIDHHGGADAYYGGADGDGIMYIPCNENENLNLIIRVMHCGNFTLGETVIDACKLFSSGKEVSFPLTRNGAPEKVK